jgi:hypothetical protein
VRCKPPSPKTTWGIIYGILGFLALLMLMVSVRWLIKGKADETAIRSPAFTLGRSMCVIEAMVVTS